MSPCITPLHLSCCRGTEDDVRLLSEVLNVDPQALHRLQHALSSEFAMPLMCAAEAGHPACLSLLVERGASLVATDRKGRLAVFYAVRAGSAACLELLLLNGAEVNCIEEGVPNTSYLEMACHAGHEQVVEVLMRHGAISVDPKVLRVLPSPSYVTPLSIAASKGHTQCLKWLLLYGALTDLSHVSHLSEDMQCRNSLVHILTDLDTGKATLEQRKDVLRLLHEFGFELTVRGGQQNILDLLQQREQPSESLVTCLSQLLATPRTLQSACRVVIRRALGSTEYTIRLQDLKVSKYDRKISTSRLNGFMHFYDA